MDSETRKKIQERLNQSNSSSNNDFKSVIWKMKAVEKGETEGPVSTIRVINYPFTDESDPFPELYFHYGVGQGPGILCPKFNAGRSCPICEFQAELNSGSEKDKELAKTLRPSNRYYAIVVDREDETLSPKYWGFGVTVWRELLGKYIDTDYEHFMNPESGIDINVKFVKEAGKKYPNTDVSFRRKDTPLAESEEEIKKILDAIKPINEVFKPLTTSEIKKRLNDWLSFGEDEAEGNSGETTRGKVASDTAELEDDGSVSSEKVEDVEAAFAAALAD